MKKIVLLVVSIVFIIGTVEAQSEFQKFFWSKRYKKCLAERDQLLAENKNLKKDTLDLHTIIIDYSLCLLSQMSSLETDNIIGLKEVAEMRNTLIFQVRCGC